MWHLPFIRAIAAVSPGGKVTFFAPPTSSARELLAAEPAVAEVLYFNNAGSELQRLIDQFRLIALLRRNRFRALWILDRTVRPAVAGFLAGIPERIGIGFTPQRWFITNKGLDQSHFHDFPIDWLIALMADMRVPLPTTEPNLRIAGDLLAAVHPDKDWPTSYWAEFLGALRGLTNGTVFLIGGPAHVARAQALIADTAGANAVNACDLKVAESAALLRHADLFVGTDSGPLNLAAATGTEAFGLFGATPVLRYSKFIHAIVPEGGRTQKGMQRILPAQALEDIKPYLSRRKEQA
jgi:heptosyltransferase-2